MPHIFEPEKAQILESEWRKKVFPAEKIVETINSIRDLKKNVAFDVGAGTGYLTVPLSRIFKKVYAVEISEKMVAKLRERLERDKILNVGIVLSEKPPEIDFKIDLVLFSNVLHEMDDPAGYLRWAERADYILVAEWKKDAKYGPPPEERISLDELQSMCDFKIILVDELPYHYIAVMKPK